MSVLNRKLFNRGGRVSSRGVGITSGLVPVQRFSNGGEANRFDELFQEKRETLESIVPPREDFNRFQAATPALLNFFSNLMSGRSLQGGLGGALDITGQALQQLPGIGGGSQVVAPLAQTNPYLQAAGAVGALGTGLGALIGN